MKELSLRDLVFTQIFFAVDLPRIGWRGSSGRLTPFTGFWQLPFFTFHARLWSFF